MRPDDQVTLCRKSSVREPTAHALQTAERGRGRGMRDVRVEKKKSGERVKGRQPATCPAGGTASAL